MLTTALLHDIFLSTSGVCTDSRNVFAGCIFFALKGETFNGNKYAAEALAQGAAYAVVDEEVAQCASYLRVDDALSSLQALATYHRRHLNIPIVAITGTNGKTTTKELIAAVLSRKLRVAATQKNLNNHIGVPLTLLSMSKDTQVGIVEMGANHAGEIAQLCGIAQPNVGLITNVGKAHLAGFGSVEGVKKAKGELYSYLAQHNGQAFYLSDSPDLTEMLHTSGIRHAVAYGLRENGATVDEATSAEPFLRLCMGNGERWQAKLIGSYNAPNVLAAVAVGRYFGVAEKDIREAVEGYTPQNHRSQLLQTSRNTIIVDAYNANPTSMSAAVAHFAQLEADNKLLMLGDMLELGSEAQKEHEALLHLLRQKNLHDVWLVGKCFCEAAKDTPYLRFESSVELCKYLQSNSVAAKLILLKGSRGMKLENVLEYL
jgi:UDP-N-acetylmuramoyl-tripeptide--D-alanyl-D-alanine ligase